MQPDTLGTHVKHQQDLNLIFTTYTATLIYMLANQMNLIYPSGSF